MIATKPKVKKVFDTLEREVKKSAESIKQNFTALPAEMLAQVTGKEIKPPKNYTDIDTSLIEAQQQAKSDQELDEVRQRLAGFQQPSSRQHFNQFRAEERQAIEEIEQEKKTKQDEEKRELQLKMQEEAEQKKAQEQAPIPKGKVRGSIFSPKQKVKTAENRPSFGKM